MLPAFLLSCEPASLRPYVIAAIALRATERVHCGMGSGASPDPAYVVAELAG
jgi:hypothetical protein